MNQGVYIVANDKVADNAIALLNSVRSYDPEIPVMLLPFNEQYHQVAATLKAKHDVTIFPDLDLVNHFTQQVGNIFDRDFLNLPNKMRKFLLWFGPFERFLYIDTDIVVFQPLTPLLDYLADYEFLCCDHHHKKRKLKDIFAPLDQVESPFSEAQLQDVFNSGFWGSRQGLFSLDELYDLFREAAAHREYFDFTYKVTDQPLLNFVILKTTQKRLNLTKLFPYEPGSWGGSLHFQERDRILYDGDRRLRYLHWAGQPMAPGGPYRELWEHYRYLGEERPPTSTQATASEFPLRTWLRQLKNQIKTKI